MKMKNTLQPTRLLADALKLPASSRALIAQKLLESLESQEAIDAARPDFTPEQLLRLRTAHYALGAEFSST